MSFAGANLRWTSVSTSVPLTANELNQREVQNEGQIYISRVYEDRL